MVTGPYPRDYAVHDERMEPVDRRAQFKRTCLWLAYGAIAAVAPLGIIFGFIVKGAG